MRMLSGGEEKLNMVLKPTIARIAKLKKSACQIEMRFPVFHRDFKLVQYGNVTVSLSRAKPHSEHTSVPGEPAKL